MKDHMKTAFVTGVSRGIGRSICERLIRDGYFVHGTYNSSGDDASQLASLYESSLKLYKVDFGQRDKTLELLAELKTHRFDAIVNNAGTFSEEEFANLDMTEWDNVIEVNLTTPLLVTTELIQSLNPGAAIVNVSSTDGFTGSFGSMAYSASKAALSNLTKSLSNNLASSGFRVNAVCPGWINTGMSTEASLKATHLTPVGRNGKPSEVASVVAFLLSEEASFVTGANVFVDGGYTNVDTIMCEEAGRISVTFE